MLRDLLLLRMTFPAGFRGLRFLALIMFWGSVLVLGIAFVVELSSPPGDHDTHGHVQRLERRARP